MGWTGCVAALVFSALGCTGTARPSPSAGSGGDGDGPLRFDTFSIVAADPDTGEVGVAAATRLPAVGMYVPFADPSAGAVASQAVVNPAYGPRALALLRLGRSPAEVIAELTGDDREAPDRQITVVSAKGEIAAYTGSRNGRFAGHRTGAHYAVAGNILSSEAVLTKMAAAFEATRGRLSDRLLAAMAAGDAAGGDARGKQSAAVLVVRPGAYFNGKVVDLRVDDHPRPIDELARVHGVYMTSFLNLPGYAPLREGDEGPHVRKLNAQLAARFPEHAAALRAAGDAYAAASHAALARFLDLPADSPAPLPLTPAHAYRLQAAAAAAAKPATAPATP